MYYGSFLAKCKSNARLINYIGDTENYHIIKKGCKVRRSVRSKSCAYTSYIVYNQILY